MTPFIIFLAVSGGVFWAAIGAVAIALALFRAIDVIEEHRYRQAIRRARERAEVMRSATPSAAR